MHAARMHAARVHAGRSRIGARLEAGEPGDPGRLGTTTTAPWLVDQVQPGAVDLDAKLPEPVE